MNNRHYVVSLSARLSFRLTSRGLARVITGNDCVLFSFKTKSGFTLKHEIYLGKSRFFFLKYYLHRLIHTQGKCLDHTFI